MAGSDETQRAIGRLEGRVGAVESTVTEIKGDTKTILTYINEQKGGFHVIAVISTAGGILGGGILTAVFKALPFLGLK